MKVRSRDLAISAAILFDKRQLLRALPTRFESHSNPASLADQLRNWAQRRQGRVIDGRTVQPAIDE